MMPDVIAARQDCRQAGEDVWQQFVAWNSELQPDPQWTPSGISERKKVLSDGEIL